MIRWIVILLGMLAAMAGSEAGADEPALTSLDPLRWDRRVVLVFAESGEAEMALEQLREEEAAFQERDMSWFLVESGEVTASNFAGPLDPALGPALADRFLPANRPLEVVLVGKDGGIKARGDQLDVVALAGQVDRMPMRQREVRERGE